MQCPLDDQPRTEDGAGVAGHHILAGGRPLMRFEEGGQLGDRVGVVGRVLQNGCLFEVQVGGQVDEGGGAQRNHPAHAEGLARVQHVGGADHVDGLEVIEVLTRAAQQRRAVNRRFGPRGRAKHVIGVADIALDQFDADPGERGGLVRVTHQGPDMVAALDQLLADVAAGLPGGTGDEDRAGHRAPPHCYIYDSFRNKCNS